MWWIALSLIQVFAHQPEVNSSFPFSSKDWTVVAESEDPYLGVASCRVYTSRSSGSLPIQFSLSFPKDFVKAPVAMIALGSDFVGEKVEIFLNSNSSAVEHALPLNVQNSGQKTTYWYVPMRMDQLIDYIVKANLLDIVVQTESGQERLRVSLAGSALTLLKAQDCLGKNELYSSQFFAELNDPSIPDSTVNGSISTLRLQELFQMSYMFYFALSGLKENLNEMSEANKEALLKESAALGVLDQTRKEYNGAEENLKSLEKELKTLGEKITSSKAELEVIAPQRAEAEAMHKAVLDLYTPLKPQHEKFKSDIVAEQLALISVERSIETTKSALDKKLEVAAKLNEKVRASGQALEVLNEQRADLEQKLNAFDTEMETQERVKSHGRISVLEQEIQKIKNDLPPIEDQVRRAIQGQIQAQREFEKCRKANNSQSVAQVCSSAMSELQKAQVNTSNSQGQLRRMNVQISMHESERGQIRQDIRNQVMAERNEIQNLLNAVKDSIQDIGSLQTRLTAHTNDKSAIEERTRALSQRFEEFKTSSRYDERHKTLLEAQKKVDELKLQEADLISKIPELEKRQGELIAVKPSAAVLVAERLTRLNHASQAVLEVQKGLVSYRVKEEEIKMEIEALMKQYDLSRGHYQYALKEILN